MSAPARTMPSTDSAMTRSRSIHPRCAAASPVPVAAYQVSGEYAMVEAAATSASTSR